MGARVTGLEPGPAKISAKLINPDTAEEFVVDSRVVELELAPDGSGELEANSETSANFAHLLTCPNYEPRPVEGVDWVLDIELGDPDDETHSGSATVHVVPGCEKGSRLEDCQCECAPNYTFGKCGAPG